jgi:hypothetical protein
LELTDKTIDKLTHLHQIMLVHSVEGVDLQGKTRRVG